MHIKVGVDTGDVVGSTNRALQIAANALAAEGGGTLEISSVNSRKSSASTIALRISKRESATSCRCWSSLVIAGNASAIISS